jgi:hypothetical protein
MGHGLRYDEVKEPLCSYDRSVLNLLSSLTIKESIPAASATIWKLAVGTTFSIGLVLTIHCPQSCSGDLGHNDPATRTPSKLEKACEEEDTCQSEVPDRRDGSS